MRHDVDEVFIWEYEYEYEEWIDMATPTVAALINLEINSLN